MSSYQSRSHVTRPGSATKVVLFSQGGLDGNRRARADRRAHLEALADGPFEPVVPAVGEVFLGSRIFLVPTLGNLEVIRQELGQVDELADEGAVLVEHDDGVEERLPAGAAALARLVTVDDDVGELEGLRRTVADRDEVLDVNDRGRPLDLARELDRRVCTRRRAHLDAIAELEFLVVQAVREVLVGSGILLVPALGNLEVIRQKLRQIDELADEGAVLVEDDNGVEERLPAGAAALARLVAVDDDVGVLERRRAADLREGRPDEGEALDRAGIVADNVDVSYIG